MSAANKFSLPRRPFPVDHGLVASCSGPPAAFFCQSFCFAQAPPMLPQHMCGTRFAESAQTGMVASQSGLRRTVRKVFARHHAVKPSSSFKGGFCLCQTHNPSNLDCRPTVSEEATSLLSENEFAVTVPRVPFLHQTRWLGNPEQPSFFLLLFPSLALLFSATQTGPIVRSGGIPSPPMEFSMEQFVTPPGCMRDPQRLRFN